MFLKWKNLFSLKKGVEILIEYLKNLNVRVYNMIIKNTEFSSLFYKIKGDLPRNRLINFFSKNIKEDKNKRKENNGNINRPGKKPISDV